MSLPSRVIGLLSHPSAEWAAIAGEPADVAALYRSYIAILAAIPSVALVAGIALSAGRSIGILALTTAITAALVSYAIALAVPYATAVVVEHLAPRFQSDGATAQALALIAYSSTPIWLAGLCYLAFDLSRFVVIGFAWAVYLFYTGSTPIMGTPVDQRVPFTLVAAIAVLAVQTILGAAVTVAGIPHYGF